MNRNQEKIEIELKDVEDVSVPKAIDNADGHNNNSFDDEPPPCRLCFCSDYDDSDLIEPCLCKGTIAKVHRKCLERWLTKSRSTKCDLCLFELNCEEKLRYGLFESIAIWLHRRTHLQLLLYDLTIFSSVNIIALPIIVMLLRHIRHICTSNGIVQNFPVWYSILLGTTLFMWIGVYFMNGFVIVNAQIRPWYCWWKSKKRIQLLWRLPFGVFFFLNT